MSRQHFIHLRAMQMTVERVSQVGDMVKENAIRFDFWCSVNQD